ncbi:S1C family serine protease [Algoriphagus sediminis]|uniref:Trypsin-like peptidase domain-containing protein n=1 Tax=Algoriphagus sediminis TaxID=3057113 RepID=A0ABT7YGB3_9BACT|nr:trypsin-like peptidase domain-containing protein [Algoriphagus sediminis]MDN3205568.1 trypsin-like peptidase domain-containing protein [Algoriphagus sediminis]
MNKRQFFFGMILASLMGGLVVLAGLRFFVQPESGQTFDEKQQASFVNLLSDKDFTIPDGINFVASAEVVTPAVVYVNSKVNYNRRGRSELERFFGMPPRDLEDQEEGMPPQGISSGSGVIISADGYIVTNNHVVEGANEVTVSLENNKRYIATIVGTDPTTDLALLKIEDTGLPYVRFGDSDETQIGEWVLAVGNPFNLNSTVTAGIISAKARNIGILRGVENDLQIESFLQTDAVVNPGNSGGALVNLSGELIGINTAIATRTGTFSGYSFAVPSTLVKKVMDDLMEYGTVQRGLLGVRINNVSPELQEALDLDLSVDQGVYVAGVNEGSGGAEAGLQEGDVIIGIDGRETLNVATLQEMVARKRPGDQVEVDFIRDGEKMSAKATLKNFDGDTKIVIKEQPQVFEFAGVTFEDIDEDLKEALDLQGGAIIDSVTNPEWRRAGARVGFVITSIISENGRIRITSPEQLIEELSDLEDEEIVVLGTFPDGTEYYFEVTP